MSLRKNNLCGSSSLSGATKRTSATGTGDTEWWAEMEGATKTVVTGLSGASLLGLVVFGWNVISDMNDRMWTKSEQAIYSEGRRLTMDEYRRHMDSRFIELGDRITRMEDAFEIRSIGAARAPTAFADGADIQPEERVSLWQPKSLTAAD